MEIQFLLQQFCEYSSCFRGFARATIRRYRQAVSFYQQFSGIKIIEEVTDENTRALFFYGRTEHHWKVNTFLSYHKSLSVFFNWCKEHNHIKENPIDKIEIPKLEKRLPRKLNRQEAMRLLEIVANYPYESKFTLYRNLAIFSTFVFAGLRKKELLNLTYTDVDIDNMLLMVRQGKGSKDRLIPICHALAENLKRYMDERKRHAKTCPEFFTSSTHNAGLNETALKRLVIKISKVTGASFTIHQLRHTFATLMLEGGCDIYSLSKMMGHSDIKTTTIYLSATAEHLRSQIMKHPLNQY